MNPLYQQLLNNMPGNNVMNLLQRFTQFRNSFIGNPQQQAQNILRSMNLSQEQYNSLIQQTNQLYSQFYRN